MLGVGDDHVEDERPDVFEERVEHVLVAVLGGLPDVTDDPVGVLPGLLFLLFRSLAEDAAERRAVAPLTKPPFTLE